MLKRKQFIFPLIVEIALAIYIIAKDPTTSTWVGIKYFAIILFAPFNIKLMSSMLNNLLCDLGNWVRR